jgi:hypothetical protein
MKKVLALALAVFALLAGVSEGRAATQLVFRTPESGVTVTRGQRLTIATLDLSPYDRVRVVAVSRANGNGFGPRLPATVRLFIGEGEALALFDTLTFTPDSTVVRGATGTVLGRLDSVVTVWSATRLYDHPVFRTVAVVAVGEEFLSTTIPQQVIMDLFIYGEIEPR